MNPIQELISSIAADQGALNQLAGALSAGGVSFLKADAFTGGSSGQQLVWYDLEDKVKFMYAFLQNVPIVVGNAEKGIPPMARVAANGGTATHWKTVTGIDVTSVAGGVGRGQRGAAMVVNTIDSNAPFVGLGVEVPVDFETRYESGPLTPEPLAIAANTGLQALMIAEEKLIIGGNASLALGIPNTPTVSDDGIAVSGQSVPGSLSVIIVALTNEGYLRATQAPPTGGSTVVYVNGVSSTVQGPQGFITRQNMDGTSLKFGGGNSAISTAGTATITSTHGAYVTWTVSQGAVAYAVYWGTTGNEVLGAITTISGYHITNTATSTNQNASFIGAVDASQDAYVFDGIITQMTGSSFGQATNSYIFNQVNGTTTTIGSGVGLTADGAGGVVEFDTLLKNRWDNYRIGMSPGRIFMNSQEIGQITKVILQSPSGVTSLFRSSALYANNMTVGFRVTAYHNKYTNEDIPIEVHPWVPAGTIIFWSDKIPYPLPNTPNLIQFKVRQGYYEIDWPLATRQYQFGVYTDECLENYATFAFGMINNLGNVV